MNKLYSGICFLADLKQSRPPFVSQCAATLRTKNISHGARPSASHEGKCLALNPAYGPDTDSPTFKAKVKLQLNLYETVSVHSIRNSLQIRKNPWNTEKFMKILQKWYLLAVPSLPVVTDPGCERVCEMETFSARSVNLPTSYRELWRHALGFFTIHMSVNQNPHLPGRIFRVEYRVTGRIKMGPGFLH